MIDINFKKKCDIYSDILLIYNKTHHISGVKNRDDIKRYIDDSIYPKKFLENKSTIVDIGSGAGFPGLIIAMAYPNSRVFLIEPNLKKSAFLHLAKSKLGLENVKVISKRAEDCEKLGADLIVSRAVSDIETVLKISKNFIKKETAFLLYKGSSFEKELDKSFKYDIIKNRNRHFLYIRSA